MFPHPLSDSHSLTYARQLARLCQSRLKLRGQITRPGANGSPVAHITGWHVFEGRYQIVGEGELLRVELAANDGNRLWGQPRKLHQLFIELPAHFLIFLLLGMEWAERENGHRPRLEGFSVPRQELERVLVLVEHVERRPQHDRAVLIEGLHLSHEPNIDRKPPFAQRRRDCLGHLLR